MKDINDITLDWILQRVEYDGDCMEWTGACANHIRPQARIGGKAYVMARVMWSLAHEKEVPNGLRVSPKCKNPKCIHPDHLRALPANTVLRGLKRSTATIARIALARRKGSRWTDEQIREVASSDDDIDTVAQSLGMHRSYVHYIRKGEARVDYRNPYLQLLKAA